MRISGGTYWHLEVAGELYKILFYWIESFKNAWLNSGSYGSCLCFGHKVKQKRVARIWTEFMLWIISPVNTYFKNYKIGFLFTRFPIRYGIFHIPTLYNFFIAVVDSMTTSYSIVEVVNVPYKCDTRQHFFAVCHWKWIQLNISLEIYHFIFHFWEICVP